MGFVKNDGSLIPDYCQSINVDLNEINKTILDFVKDNSAADEEKFPFPKDSWSIFSVLLLSDLYEEKQTWNGRPTTDQINKFGQDVPNTAHVTNIIDILDGQIWILIEGEN